MKGIILGITLAAGLWAGWNTATACTGITLQSKDGSIVLARTIEWGGSYLNSRYVVVPRGYTERSYTPDGTKGMTYTARYGYVGIAVEQKEFVTEGVNEAGLSAGLFYFPDAGEYEAYDEQKADSTVSDLQLVPWLLGHCATVEEVQEAVAQVHIVNIDPRSSTAHWRFADASGRQVVLEITGGTAHFYENPLGVLTNSPGFEWHLTNLNNYVNLFPGAAPDRSVGTVRLSPFGAGSGFLGLPGDATPPSRFVRAAFYQAATPLAATGTESVLQAFQLLNSFDIPIGTEFAAGEKVTDIPSATQWTSATDLTGRLFYFRSMYDSRIRCINLKTIDFTSVAYRALPLDPVRQQPVEAIHVE